jgi:hypothetical protein
MSDKPELSAELRAHLAALGKRGATARNKALSTTQRAAIAKKAAAARWAKDRAPHVRRGAAEEER